MSQDTVIPVTLLLTEKEIDQILQITRDHCKLKEKEGTYCSKIECYREYFKVENGMVRPKYYATHNCLKLIEAKDAIKKELP